MNIGKRLSDREQAFVDLYTGECNYNGSAACRKLGYAHPGPEACRLLKKAHIRAYLDAHMAELRGESLRSRAGRIARLEELDRKMNAVIEARAKAVLDGGDDPTGLRKTFGLGDAVAPGAETGLMVKTTKVVGAGRHQSIVTEWAVDTGLLRELRETSKQVATEVGEWNEKRQVTGVDEGPIQVERVDSAIERFLLALAAEDDPEPEAEDPLGPTDD